jgi:hypothetical protein
MHVSRDAEIIMNLETKGIVEGLDELAAPQVPLLDARVSRRRNNDES